MEMKTEFCRVFGKLLSENNFSYLSDEKYLNIIIALKGGNKSLHLN